MRTHWQALPFLVLPGLALLAPGFVPDLEWTTLSGVGRELALRPRLLELALAGWLPAEAFARLAAWAGRSYGHALAVHTVLALNLYALMLPLLLALTTLWLRLATSAARSHFTELNRRYRS